MVSGPSRQVRPQGRSPAGTDRVRRPAAPPPGFLYRLARALLWAEVNLVAGTVAVYRSGEVWQDHGLVFCRADGTLLDR